MTPNRIKNNDINQFDPLFLEWLKIEKISVKRITDNGKLAIPETNSLFFQFLLTD